MHRGDEKTHGYVVNVRPRHSDDFAGVIADSYRPEATFMNAVLVSRYGAPRQAMVRNLTLIHDDGAAAHVTPIPGVGDLPSIIEREFGMPARIVAEALDGVELAAAL
jgi:hypothetical protein